MVLIPDAFSEQRVANKIVLDVPSGKPLPIPMEQLKFGGGVEVRFMSAVYKVTRPLSEKTRRLAAKLVCPAPVPVVDGSEGAKYGGTTAMSMGATVGGSGGGPLLRNA